MSFKSPWLLLGLLVLALASACGSSRSAVGLATPCATPTSTCSRPWSRGARGCVMSRRARCARPRGADRGHRGAGGKAHACAGARHRDPRRRHVALDAGEGCRTDAARRCTGGDRTFLDQAPHGLRIGLVVFAGEAQVATPPTRTTHWSKRRSRIRPVPCYGGTAIGDALQTAVLLGRQVTISCRRTRTARGAPIVDRPTRSRDAARPVDVWEREEPGVDPLPLRRRADAWPSAAARGREAREGGVLPVYTVALGTPQGVIERGPFGGFPGNTQDGQVIPVPPDPDTLRADRAHHRRRVHGGAHSGRAPGAYQNLGSRLGREPGQSEITWLFIAIAAALLLLATAIGAFVSPRLP